MTCVGTSISNPAKPLSQIGCTLLQLALKQHNSPPSRSTCPTGTFYFLIDLIYLDSVH